MEHQAPAPGGAGDERDVVMTRTRAHMYSRDRSRRRGFTLIELLMVVAIIGLLIGLLIVALNKVRGSGELGKTEQLMRSIDTGLAQFKNDHGFLPPLLDDTIANGAGIELTPYPIDQSDDLDYYSVLSLAPYLVGVGDLNGDAEVDEYDDGVEGAGFRDPGADRSWGYSYQGSSGRGRKAYWQSKEKLIGDPAKLQIPGRTYGPYIQLSEDQQIRFAKNRAGVELREPALFSIQDFWGGSIRYYRHWPKVFPQGETLEDHVPVWFGSFQADQLESFRMQTRSVDYILMSVGPDGKAENDELDAEENKDNLVRAQS